jgi:hypothetical protein
LFCLYCHNVAIFEGFLLDYARDFFQKAVRTSSSIMAVDYTMKPSWFDSLLVENCTKVITEGAAPDPGSWDYCGLYISAVSRGLVPPCLSISANLRAFVIPALQKYRSDKLFQVTYANPTLCVIAHNI